jgi:hypothetical protein
MDSQGRESAATADDSVTLANDTSQTVTVNARFKKPGHYVVTLHVVVTIPDPDTPPGAPCVLEGDTDVPFDVSDIRLLSVAYAGASYYEVKEDKDGSGYSAPHWEDGNEDGDAADANEKRYPVAFKRNTKMTVTATFKVYNAAALTGVKKVKGSGSGFSFPETAATLAGDKLSATIPCDNAFANTVDFLNPLTLNWQATGDGGTTWMAGGTSDNRVYVTLDAPTSTLFETVADIGGRNAKGKATANDVMAAIWGDFSGPTPGVKRKPMDGHNVADGHELTYWNGGAATATNTGALLKDGNGQCGSWAEFLRDCVLAEGVPGATKVTITSTYPNGVGTGPATGGWATGLFLVKDWTFAAAGTAPAAVAPFTHKRTEITDNAGVPGQGNANPPGGFFNHFVVKYDGKYYDPSYGAGAFAGGTADAARADWEDKSLDGFLVYYALVDPTTGAVAGFTSFAKKNAAGGGANLETAFSS